MLQDLEKSRQMTSQDFGPFVLVSTPTFTSYDVDIEVQPCSCRRWQVTGILCDRHDSFERDNGTKGRILRLMLPLRNFILAYENFFNPIYNVIQ